MGQRNVVAVVVLATMLAGCSLGLHAQMAGSGVGVNGGVGSNGPEVVVLDKDGDAWATFNVRTIAAKLAALAGGLFSPPKPAAGQGT